jgi:hypothetical protein
MRGIGASVDHKIAIALHDGNEVLISPWSDPTVPHEDPLIRGTGSVVDHKIAIALQDRKVVAIR